MQQLLVLVQVQVYEYLKISNRLRQSDIKTHKHRTPDSWASGLIRLNWDVVINMWESRIESSNHMPVGVVPIDTRYYLLQRAILLFNRTTSLQLDKKLILKSESDLANLSTTQLKLWLSYFKQY